MNKKLWQVILVMVLAGLMVASLVTPAGAAKVSLKPPTEGTASADPNLGASDQSRSSLESGTMSIQSTYLIEFWGSSIGKAGVGVVNISGYTQTNTIVDYLDVLLVLQRWNGSSWVDIYNIQSSDNNAWYVTGGTGLNVARGYYYRVRSSHYALKNSQTDYTTNYTPYIYVD
ncbi:MAG: hypothetical protein ACYC2T_01085 [Bacillota bacterium]